tara:strand:+ start:1454 stop:1960 length:507 start_codon:yes stop_codon:yes gene_type:complete
MNQFKFFLFLYISIIYCCETKLIKKTNIEIIDSTQSYSFSNPKKLVNLSMEYIRSNSLDSWSELNNFIDRFENLNNMIPEGNLVFIEELINKTDQLIKSDFPDKLDVPDIKSRIKVVKSLLLKCRYNSKNENWEDLDISLEELFISYNSLINRITSVVDENDIFRVIN